MFESGALVGIDTLSVKLKPIGQIDDRFLHAIIADRVNVFCEALLAPIANVCGWFVPTYAQKCDSVTNRELHEIRCLILVKLHRRTGRRVQQQDAGFCHLGVCILRVFMLLILRSLAFEAEKQNGGEAQLDSHRNEILPSNLDFLSPPSRSCIHHCTSFPACLRRFDTGGSHAYTDQVRTSAT